MNREEREEGEIDNGLKVRSARSSVAKRVVVVGATPSLLPVNISDWSKREGTGTGRREGEPESEREEKRKNEERGERKGNI